MDSRSLLRYPRLYLYFLRFSASKALEFRLDFFFRVVMDTVFYAVQLGFFTVLYRHTTLLAGWGLDEVYIFVCGYLLVDALHMTLFSNNLWWLPILINRGDLDYYLVRPVSSLFFLSLREVAANSFLNVLIAAGLLVWALTRYPGELGAGRIVLYLALLFLGTGIYFLVRLIFVVPVFWMHSNHGLAEASWAMTRLGERPVEIYGRWLKRVLLTVLPMGLMASVPASVLFDGFEPRVLLSILTVAGGFFVFAVWFWQRGLRAYSSASS